MKNNFEPIILTKDFLVKSENKAKTKQVFFQVALALLGIAIFAGIILGSFYGIFRLKEFIGVA